MSDTTLINLLVFFVGGLGDRARHRALACEEAMSHDIRPLVALLTDHPRDEWALAIAEDPSLLDPVLVLERHSRTLDSPNLREIIDSLIGEEHSRQALGAIKLAFEMSDAGAAMGELGEDGDRYGH